jgi:hypothetical protein
MTVRIVALLLVSVFYKPILAQSYIEVTVQDTVMLKADYFLYTFVINNFSYEADIVDTLSSDVVPEKKETAAQRLEKEFTSIVLELKKNNFKMYSPTLIDSLTINAAAAGIIRTGTLIISNSDSLILANKILKQNEKVVAYIQGGKTVTADDEKRLYKKLLEAATKQAKSIAILAGRKIKQIESVTEKENESGYTAYPPLSSLGASVIPGWHTTIGTPGFAFSSKEIYYPIGITLTIKFSLQPTLK